MKINDDDDDDDHGFLSMMYTRVKPIIEPDNIWDYLKILDYDHSTSVVDDIDMEEDNVTDDDDDDDDDDDEEEEEEENDDQSVLLDIEENEIILETPPFSDDDDDNDEELYPTPSLLPFLVHTPNVSDEE